MSQDTTDATYLVSLKADSDLCACKDQKDEFGVVVDASNSGQPADINVLLMGETGVGKSTWINGFANYLTYSTLDEAKEAELVALIPIYFTITKNGIENTVRIGKDENEQDVPGQSVTQFPKTYIFKVNNVTVRLIDTPGIGDTRGVEIDKSNFQNTLTHIASLDKLHGICILLKPNDSRLTLTFEYCIKELLIHLHKDACRNMVFCFTNSRSTFYEPGDTMPILKKLLTSSEVDIPLTKENYFCFDNEAIRFLAAVKSNVQFSETEHQVYSGSWKKSVEESERLFKRLISTDPHLVRDTLSLNDVRQLILGLYKPLQLLTENIQKNLGEIKKAKTEIGNSSVNVDSATRKCYLIKHTLKIVRLDDPLVVCTLPSCITDRISGNEVLKYHTCRRGNVNLYRFCMFGTYGLLNLAPCVICGCKEWYHERIYFETVDVEGKVPVANITELKKEGRELEAEQKQINSSCAKFAVFLKANAVVHFNDVMDKYLESQVKNIENSKDPNKEQRIRGIVALRQSYDNEKKLLEEEMAKTNAVKPTTSEIKELIDSLYRMKHTGESLKEIETIQKDAANKAAKMTEVVVEQKKKPRWWNFS